MGYLPHFVEDVFISYAHIDDDAYAMETQGWVAQLDEDLRKRVAVFLDGQQPAVWRDREVRSNDDFAQKIAARLLSTATFLSIISPSFFRREWCMRELEEFATSAQRSMGVKVGEKNRIFKVEKVPLGFDRTKLPPQLQGTGSYKFYGPDPEHEGRIHEYRPKLGCDYAARYWREMDDLAQDIATVLKQMNTWMAQTVTAQAPSITVYFAETTSDLDDSAKELRRDLKARGYMVLPEGDLPYRCKDLKRRVDADLGNSMISIHMFGSEYGFIPEGEIEKSNAWLQHDCAVEHQRQHPGFVRLLWMPPNLAATDARQNRFLDFLHNDPVTQTGADVIESNVEDLKTLVQEKLTRLRDGQEKQDKNAQAAISQPTQAAVSDEPVRIYLICDQLDVVSPDLLALRNYLFGQGYECILPTVNLDEREALQEHADSLEICDGCVIYYGQGSDRWFSAKLRELRKFLSVRSKPVRAKAVFIAPPDSLAKRDVQTREAIVLRGGDSFTAEPLAPFLRALEEPSRKEAGHDAP